MKFRIKVLGLLFWGLVSWTAFSQQLSNDEIVNEYRKNQTTPRLDSLYRQNVYAGTRMLLDELLQNGVDTLVVYSVSFPGYIPIGKNDSCSTLHPTSTYFFWKKSGKYFFKVTDGCKSRSLNTTGKVVKFATAHFAKIKDEFFMDAITGATKNGESLVVSESWVDHEPKYSLLVFVHGQYNYLTFNENGLTNKKSLFLDYNKELTSFELFELIKREIGSE
jgi:hypothetical protein